MTLLEAVLIAVAGLAAGTINTIVGSGTLVTFPTLLLFGYAPVSANVSNSLGLVAGGVSGAWGYRRELRGQRSTLLALVPASLVGGIIGALLLLVLPESAFETIVPALIALALVLVVVGPRLNKWAAAKREKSDGAPPRPGWGWPRWTALVVGVLLGGVYGGYFGAAQGVLLVGLMGVLLPLGLQQINGIKNVLAMVVNLVAADLSRHRSQPFTERLADFADLILTMTEGHRQAIIASWPQAAPRTHVVRQDGVDVSDPVGLPVDVYRSTARQISDHLKLWSGPRVRTRASRRATRPSSYRNSRRRIPSRS